MSSPVVDAVKPDYQNSDFPIDERVADLLSRMNLEEKAAQMVCVWNEKAEKLIDAQGNFDPERAREHFGHGHGLGQIGRISDTGDGKNAREMAELTNTIQQWFLENSRLPIPVVFHEECLHGLMGPDATSFPQPISMGATFNPELVRQIGAATAAETRSRGGHFALSPVLDVAREPRWGRVEETFGEDPYLVAQLGMAAVEGLQGDGTFAAGRHVAATLKHFAAHGEPESGTNCAPVNVSERILREVFLFPFRKVIEESHPFAVMASYNEIDGVPSHANRWLLRQVLRDEWRFDGVVVSDYYAIRELDDRPGLYGHHVAHDGKEAAELAVRAGVNIELPEPDCYQNLVELVREGRIAEEELDELVSPLLRQKFQMGLFDAPFADADQADELACCDSHRQIALQAARETITLLKNDGGLAPLKLEQLSTIAVIGPNADRELLGGYSGKPHHVLTVLEGIRQHVGDSAHVVYHEGCKITEGGSWFEDDVVRSDPAEDRRRIAEAVEVAREADVIVLAVGGNEQTSREAWMSNHMGDRTNLEMVGLQDELVDALAELGKPIVALLFNGRPLSVRNLVEKSQALFECWYLGQETGRAVAEVLFGEICPSGKLPITIPRSVGHTPAFYNYKPSARRGYLFDDVSPLFAFGYGMSYTRFEFGKPELENHTISLDESTTVSVEVSNRGECRGEEVVQLYIRDCVSSVTRPVRELKGFQRVTLEPGETKRVTLEITPESLAFYDIEMHYRVEPGEFEVMVGNSSRDEDLQQVVLMVAG